MDKKAIYEHLAKIYLDASSSKQKKDNLHPKLFKYLFLSLCAICVVVLAVFLSAQINSRRGQLKSEIALVLTPDVVKINFHFDPARREIYSVALNKLDLSRYRSLSFQVKKANYQDNIALRVEFASAYKEKAVVYLKDIPHKWQDYKIKFSDFSGISDWSNMSGLGFVVEEWNVREKKGVVYIDNVRFLK